MEPAGKPARVTADCRRLTAHGRFLFVDRRWRQHFDVGGPSVAGAGTPTKTTPPCSSFNNRRACYFDAIWSNDERQSVVHQRTDWQALAQGHPVA